MTTTPQAAAAATKDLDLPPGDDERVIGFGVMGLPFASGHYLAFRDSATPIDPVRRDITVSWPTHQGHPADERDRQQVTGRRLDQPPDAGRNLTQRSAIPHRS